MRGSYLLVISVGFAIGCRNGDRVEASATAAPVSVRQAELYFTTEVAGYIEPCGCTSKPLGGLARLATVIRSHPGEHALVDAGNLLLPTKGLDDLTRDQHLLKAGLLARVYRRLGVAAINVAEADLAGGAKLLAELQREGAMPFVSSNVRPVGAGGPAVARSFMRTVGGIKFGITGAATPERVAGVSKDFAVIEYAPAVAAEVEALREEGAELIVVLAHVGERAARDLARTVPDIDVLVWGPGTRIERIPKGPSRVGKVLMVEAGSQGQHLGRLSFRLGPSLGSKPLLLDDSALVAIRRRHLTERKVKAYRMEVEAWRVDPKKVEAVRVKEAQIRKLQAELDQPISASKPLEGPHVRVELIRLESEIRRDPATQLLLDGYYAALDELNQKKGDLSACRTEEPDQARYVGNAKCVECHEEAMAFWKKTKHAEAWQTLVADNKQSDLTCVGCHVVGYRQPGGFCRLVDSAPYRDVGCESCHGPGSTHIEDEDPSSISLGESPETCTGGCHVPEHSDAFVYESYVREITGPGHERGD